MIVDNRWASDTSKGLILVIALRGIGASADLCSLEFVHYRELNKRCIKTMLSHCITPRNILMILTPVKFERSHPLKCQTFHSYFRQITYIHLHVLFRNLCVSTNPDCSVISRISTLTKTIVKNHPSDGLLTIKEVRKKECYRTVSSTYHHLSAKNRWQGKLRK